MHVLYDVSKECILDELPVQTRQTIHALVSGVPQGIILCPLLFSLYWLLLGRLQFIQLCSWPCTPTTTVINHPVCLLDRIKVRPLCPAG